MAGRGRSRKTQRPVTRSTRAAAAQANTAGEDGHETEWEEPTPENPLPLVPVAGTTATATQEDAENFVRSHLEEFQRWRAERNSQIPTVTPGDGATIPAGGTSHHVG